MFKFENAPASAFPVATRLELVEKSCCGVSERTTIKWKHFLTFRRFPAATRPERHDLSSSTSLVDRSCCRELQLRFKNFTIREYTLRNGEVRFIGRSAENHIVLDDPHSSRRHARIARWGDELFVGDEGSKQGTVANGMQVICAKLKHGDVVNIGTSQN